MLPASGFARALREAAPGLSRRYFRCSRQFHTTPRTHHCGRSAFSGSSSRAREMSQSLSTRMHQSSSAQRWARGFSASTKNKAAAVASGAVADQAASSASRAAQKSRFPDTSSNTVAYWLLGSAASVFGIVIFGGLTRLTESGLSITEWKPVTGSLPPLSQADWEAEFEKYRASPEFKMLNSRMTLSEFKSIYWMEWVHRLWGRAVGLTFVLPAIYFVARGHVSKRMTVRLGGIAGLIGFQGFLGWWMVKSGLKDDLFAPGSHPRVSQYRLTAHLGAAFVCYLAMLTNGLSILRTNRLLNQVNPHPASTVAALRNPALRPFKIAVALLAGLTFVTAMSGALVAGLDAGLIYNEFPFMGLGLTPPKSELFDTFYSRDPAHGDLWWRNMLENPSLVQLDHRILATTTFTSVMALWAYSRTRNLKAALPRAAARGVHGVVGFASLQVILGISTLLYLVPTSLASMHQAGALALLTWTFVLGGRVWLPRHVAALVAKQTAATRTATAMAGLPRPLKGMAVPGAARDMCTITRPPTNNCSRRLPLLDRSRKA